MSNVRKPQSTANGEFSPHATNRQIHGFRLGRLPIILSVFHSFQRFVSLLTSFKLSQILANSLNRFKLFPHVVYNTRCLVELVNGVGTCIGADSLQTVTICFTVCFRLFQILSTCLNCFPQFQLSPILLKCFKRFETVSNCSFTYPSWISFR